MSMTPEKIRVLADTLFNNPVDTHIEIITSWLEQNPVDPVVIGLSDEQVDELSYRLEYVEWGYKMVIHNYLKTQTFAQPQQFQPNWDDAPDWANWLAQNLDGAWHWFKDKPLTGIHDGWANGYFGYKERRNSPYLEVNSWQQTLQQRTKPTPQVEVKQVWAHRFTRNEYYIKSLGQMKFNGEWQDSVTYDSVTYEYDETDEFTRTLEDFLANFEQVQS